MGEERFESSIWRRRGERAPKENFAAIGMGNEDFKRFKYRHASSTQSTITWFVYCICRSVKLNTIAFNHWIIMSMRGTCASHWNVSFSRLSLKIEPNSHFNFMSFRVREASLIQTLAHGIWRLSNHLSCQRSVIYFFNRIQSFLATLFMWSAGFEAWLWNINSLEYAFASNAELIAYKAYWTSITWSLRSASWDWLKLSFFRLAWYAYLQF